MNEKDTTTIQERVRAGSRLRRQDRRDALRESILRHAGDLFVDGGYESFSMRKVAERIGYSATTIYHHFRSKDDLFAALLGEAACWFHASLDQARKEATDPADAIACMGWAYVRFALDYPMHYRLLFLQRPDYLSEREDMRFLSVHDPSKLVEAVQAYQAAGGFPDRDPRAVAHALWAMTHGLAQLGLTVLKGRPQDLRAAYEACRDMVGSMAARPVQPDRTPLPDPGKPSPRRRR